MGVIAIVFVGFISATVCQRVPPTDIIITGALMIHVWAGRTSISAWIYFVKLPMRIGRYMRALGLSVVTMLFLFLPEGSVFFAAAGGWRLGLSNSFLHVGFIYDHEALHRLLQSTQLDRAQFLATFVGILTALLWPTQFGWRNWFVVRVISAMNYRASNVNQHIRGGQRDQPSTMQHSTPGTSREPDGLLEMIAVALFELTSFVIKFSWTAMLVFFRMHPHDPANQHRDDRTDETPRAPWE